MEDCMRLGWIRTGPKGKRWKCNIFEYIGGEEPEMYIDTGKTIAEIWSLEGTVYGGYRWRIYLRNDEIDPMGHCENCWQAQHLAVTTWIKES